MVDERGLDGVKRAPLRQALDRQDLRAVVADREREARVDAPPVEQDGAGPALPAVAALLGSGEVEPFAKQVEQRDTRIVQRDRSFNAVHGEGD
jgi:hypothetical protein